MEQSTKAWRSSLWARWPGWTVLFGVAVTLVIGGFMAYGPFSWTPHLGVLTLAFLLGVRFPSWRWVGVPLAMAGLSSAALAAYIFIGVSDEDRNAALMILGLPLLLTIYAAAFFLAAAGGNERRTQSSGIIPVIRI